MFWKTVSGVMLFLLVISALTLAFKIQSAKADDGTGYINAGGSTSLVSGNVVANVTSFEAIRWQQKTLFAAGRYWLFYVDGVYPTQIELLPTSTVYYTTSTDGFSWTPPTALASGLGENSGENVQAFLSNSGYLEVFYRTGMELFYRMGTPNSDGSITWTTPNWQLVFNANAVAGSGLLGMTCDFFATVDSNNYPWVSWGYVQEPTQSLNPSDIKMYVWKDAFNNGIWQTASGFPYNVGTGNYTNDFMVPLSNGQIYVMYFLDNPPLTGQIYGELWNGTAWGPQETCTTSQVNEQYAIGHESWDRTAVADSNDNIFLAFLSTDLNLVFVERTMNGGWSSETVVQADCGDYSSPSLNLYNDNLRLFWINSSTSICYKNYLDGVWDTEPTLIVNETNSQIAVGTTYYGTDDGRLNAFTMSFDGCIGLLWVNNQTATNTGQIMFGLQPQAEPEYSNIGLSRTAANLPCTFSCCWADTQGLYAFVFSTNNTGSWQNDSAVSLSGTFAWTNVTKTLNPTVGTVVGYEWFANDTNGNWASTGILTLTTREPFHDVAVTNVASSSPVVAQGYGTDINVTVADPGDFTETFNVTAYANTTSVGSENVTLAAGNSMTITLTWNTTGFAYGNYMLSAYAWPVPGETDTANNNCTGGWVTVLPGGYISTEPIYIMADGSVQPSTAPISSVDNVTYTLTGNITGNVTAGSSAIIIQRDNVTIDGAGNTLQGTNTDDSTGIQLTGTSNVTIKNMQITAFSYGIELDSSSNNSIAGNDITNNNVDGILIDSSSSNNSVSGNNVTNNEVDLDSSSYNSVNGNSFVNCGLSVSGSYANAVTDNLVNGKPLVYLEDVSSYAVGEAGQIVLVNCNNITVQNQNLSNSTDSVELWETNNTTISGNNITNSNYGIQLYSSDNNSVSGNNITNNDVGVDLESSSDNNSVSRNNITANSSDGISLQTSDSNSVSGNNITNNEVGVNLESSSNSNNISGNNITNNDVGVNLYSSSDSNSVSGNNITANSGGGIFLVSNCDSNSVSGNNITANSSGILLQFFCDNNSVSRNNIAANSEWGIALEFLSDSNSLSGNNITANNRWGIALEYASDSNSVSGNNITANNDCGAYLYFLSNNNSISVNNITDNGVGIDLDSSSGNSIFHNNFVGNTVQVGPDTSVNTLNAWDDGYPSGGNYWSDYQTKYPNATEIDSSGIWNTSYVIDANNTDNYPLMNPYSASPLFVTISPVSATLDVGQSQLLTSIVTGGSSPYTYQWYLNGLPVQDATSGNWTFTPTSAGSYTVYVQVNDSVGAQATSDTANVTVNYIVHDVALTNVTVPVSEAYQGWVVNVNVTVANLGNATETFAVTLNYNSTSIATLSVTDLAPNSTQTLVFSWNTTNVPCGNYTMEAETVLAPGEINVASNVLVGGTLSIRIMGDVNGEGKVDMADIMTIVSAFGSYPGHPRWNAACDLNQDGRIDLADIVLALMNFGKTS